MPERRDIDHADCAATGHGPVSATRFQTGPILRPDFLQLLFAAPVGCTVCFTHHRSASVSRLGDAIIPDNAFRLIYCDPMYHAGRLFDLAVCRGAVHQLGEKPRRAAQAAGSQLTRKTEINHPKPTIANVACCSGFWTPAIRNDANDPTRTSVAWRNGFGDGPSPYAKTWSSAASTAISIGFRRAGARAAMPAQYRDDLRVYPDLDVRFCAACEIAHVERSEL
jgi:hypothetical protein